MHSPIVFSTILVALFTTSTTALRAVPSQQCAGVCGDVTSTSESDIVCTDVDFDNTQKGRAMKSCLDCQLNSTASDPNTGESDTRWLLYNTRYTLSSCLWDFPNTSFSLQANPCVTNPACGLYQENIEYDQLSPNASAYDYCTGFNDRSQTQQPKCQSCLQELSGEVYLSNFFTILIAGCQQKPTSGTPLSLQGSTLFSTAAVNITTPVASGSSKPVTNSSSSLSIGAIAGIAIGGVALLLVAGGILIVCCGKKRRRAKLAQRAERHAAYTGFRPRAPLGGQGESQWPQSNQGGLSPADHSPQSAISAYGDKSFSPYTSQYNSPVSAQDMLNIKQAWDWKTPSTLTAGRDNHAIELEKIRDQRLAERRARDSMIHQEFLRDAAERGFTTSPIIQVPTKGMDYGGR